MIIQQSNGVAPVRDMPDARPSPPSVSPSAAAARPPVSVPMPEQIQRAAQIIGKAMQTFARNLEFSIDDSSGKTVVTVRDSETGTVVRQMPSQEALDVAKAIGRLQGLLLRQQA